MVVPEQHLDVGGNAYIRNVMGIGTPPNASWSLITSGGIYAGGTLYSATVLDALTVNVRGGNSFFGGGVGIGWANEAGYWLTVPNIKTGGVDWSGTSNGAYLILGGNLTAANVIATTTLYGVSAVLSGGITWNTPSTGTFLALSGNLNAANVIASNNLYGVTAVMSGNCKPPHVCSARPGVHGRRRPLAASSSRI